jgi:two-component system NtrC family response regulator
VLLSVPTAPIFKIPNPNIAVLIRASWIGNVRELASFVERLVVMGDEPVVGESGLQTMGLVNDVATSDLTREDGLCTLEERNREYVDLLLARTNDDKAEAARILGINLSTLYRWLKKPHDVWHWSLVNRDRPLVRTASDRT